jgi:hypothetical protein
VLLKPIRSTTIPPTSVIPGTTVPAVVGDVTVRVVAFDVVVAISKDAADKNFINLRSG